MSSPSDAADTAKREETGAKQENVQPAAPAAPAAAAPPAATVSDDLDDDVPDPDEEDLDDLDELLDGFKAVRQEMINDNTLKEGEEAADLDYENMSEEEVTKRMQAGIAGLLANLEQSPELQAQFEEMFKQMGAEMGADFEADEEEQQTSSKDKSPAVASTTAGTAANTTASTTAGASTSAPAAAPAAAAKPSQPAAEGPSGAAFQDTIRRTMERMQSSGDQATAAAAAGGEDDFLAEMLKQLTAGEFAGGSEEDFSKMLMGMMEQLTNKEILYEPMKELHDKFPAWLAKNKDSVPADDLKRYMEQKTIVEEIVAKFNEPTYSDSNAKDREYIVDRMQRMQAAGSPPSDLVGDMASAQEAFNATEDQCTPQ
ncbi:pex19 protein family domain-containing protein [Trichoderma breve]|uniref:Pex19 protein family domain-containing protein n=1 Tax=Trichoderma breve TaxID=2034170 RepID=A0A9W9JQT4_9HYPO|nr:pex19 protein family domain-containing protein [Trichoderma breve]KAJ4864136.1 pex19 protein family domain-containing protein [Trichoderma breve]